MMMTNTWMFFLLVMFYATDSWGNTECIWRHNNTDPEPTPELFYINMDSSPDRRKSIDEHLSKMNILFRRIRGLNTFKDIYFPPDVITYWNKMEARLDTDEVLPSKLDYARFVRENRTLANYTHVVTGLIGRSKKNKLKEVGCTASHLEAMRQAIYFNRSSSRYAVITEDDIQIPFNIDFNKLAATAPKGFGILQLFNSNEESMESSWLRYIRSKGKYLWTEIYQKQPGAFWSTCAYLIDREVMKPIIDKVAFLDKKGWIQFKIIAGIKQPCRPKLTACCHHINGTYSYQFIDEAPCIWAPKGFQADSFIYAMAKTYAISVPLITNGDGGNESTFHQDHVESIHASAFARQRRYINEMISGKVRVPDFASAACQTPLPVGMTLYKRPECIYRNHLLQDPNRLWPAIYWSLARSNDSSSIANARRIERSVNMTKYLEQVLTARHLQVASLSTSQLLIPSDVLRNWELKTCIYKSPSTSSTLSSFVDKVMLVSGLCGRGKGRNSLEDLALTATHLTAIYTAVHGNVSNSRFALIVEDDVLLPFDVDWQKLAKSAPLGFGMLRLVSGVEHLVEKQFHRYARNISNLWSASNTDKYYDDWSFKAYLIDRHVMQPVIDGILHRVTSMHSSLRWELQVIAGLHHPCIPIECCYTTNDNITNSQKMVLNYSIPACVDSRFGFQAERYLFKLAPTYSLNVPLVSVMYREDSWSAEKEAASKKQKQYINDLISLQTPLPQFVSIGCNRLLT